MEKRVFIWLIAIFIVSINLISAINLKIDSAPISNTVLTDLNKPAYFDITITNNGASDVFEIYSLVGIDMSPEEPISINTGETRTIRVEVMPQTAIREKQGFFTFEYRIKNSNDEIQKEKLTINVASLEKTIAIIPGTINPKSEEINIEIKNQVDYDFNNLNVKMTSAFFDYETTLSLKRGESKSIRITLDKEKIKTLNAGNYLLNTNIEVEKKNADIESMVKFLEQEDIETNEIREGWIIRRYEVEKKNIGNVKKLVTIYEKKSILAYLFTTVNVAPTETNLHLFSKEYTWEKELIPNEEIKVVVKTNWLFPLLIIALAITLYILIKRSIERDIILRKKVSFIKTKGGQFALKVSIRVKSKRFVEKINVIDRLPPLVNLYDRYGAIVPDKIDLKNKRIEWNIETLNNGEERIFSYIIYSKVGVVGKFELPSAKAIYEKEGKIKETESNRSFFINEPKNREEN